MKCRVGIHPARGLSKELLFFHIPCKNLLSWLFKQKNPSNAVTMCWWWWGLSWFHYLSPSIYRWGKLRSKEVCFQTSEVHHHALPKAFAACHTSATSHWVSPWHLGQDHHHGEALSQSLWKVSQPCPQPTKHPWQHSQVTVTRKQTCSHEWPNAHVPRYRSHFWPSRCNSFIVVVFLSSFK